MNQDSSRKNATKHYQNSDYPSGSFEAAIKADHQESLREGAGLRLERHPLAPGNSGADLEEMVPAFMHRDFFRSEEEPLGAVGSASRLRPVRKEGDAPSSGEEPSPELTLLRPESASAESSIEDSGYFEPPNTEEFPESPRTEEIPLPPTKPRMVQPVREVPAASPRPVPLEKIPLKEVEPLAPLRSEDIPAATIPSFATSATASEPLRSSPPPVGESPKANHKPSPEPEPSPAKAEKTMSAYSWPLLLAFALVMGVFVWREHSRPPVIVSEPLTVPTSVVSPVVAEEVLEPAQADVGFRPTFIAVGPPVPQDLQDGSAEASPGLAGGDDASLFPDGASEESVEDDEEERAEILERMSQPEPVEKSVPATASSSNSGDLFPMEDEGGSAPVRAASPVREAAKPKKPEAKPTKSDLPAPVPVAASAADLFPIDEELPLSQTKPKPAPAPAAAAAPAPSAPALSVQQPTAPARPAAPPTDGYQIAEPTF